MTIVRESRKSGFLVLVLVAALVFAGIGYAIWAQSLTVSTTVQTGAVSARWLANDEVPLNNAIVCNELSDRLNAAQVGAGRDAGDVALMHVTIENGYPGFTANCSLRWQNDGTVPIRTLHHQVNGVIASGINGVSLNLDAGEPGDMGDDLIVQFSNGSSPVAPGNGATDQLTIRVLDTATPGATLMFTGTHAFELAD